MTNTMYSTHGIAVDPVFYPVVPDSFMRDGTRDGHMSNRGSASVDWPEEVDRPLVSPHDRWSF